MSLLTSPRSIVSFSCKFCSDHVSTIFWSRRDFLFSSTLYWRKSIFWVPNNFCIEFKPDENRTRAKCTDTKWCLTSLLVTPWFSNPSTNLRDVSTRTGVLRFSKSQVLFQPGKRREYRPLTRHMQPYVTIKTIREKPPYSRGAFCCACASRILFGACCVICIFSARFRGFSTRRSTPFCNVFWRGMQENDKFLTLWILVVFAGPSDEDILMFKVRTKREKNLKFENLVYWRSRCADDGWQTLKVSLKMLMVYL